MAVDASVPSKFDWGKLDAAAIKSVLDVPLRKSIMANYMSVGDAYAYVKGANGLTMMGKVSDMNIDYGYTDNIWGMITTSASTAGWYSRPTSATATIKFTPADGYMIDSAQFFESELKKIGPGAKEIELPDGAKLIVDAAGNYRIEDKDAKVTYKANRIREFSPHLNASDMVARFVEYVGSLGVRQAEVLGLPLELFINWLVIEAAERDQDPVPREIRPVAVHPVLIEMKRPKCMECGRFIPRLHHRHRFPFCDPFHGARWVERKGQPRGNSSVQVRRGLSVDVGNLHVPIVGVGVQGSYPAQQAEPGASSLSPSQDQPFRRPGQVPGTTLAVVR